ncbi:MAG: polysaccharide biosynthesis tyrosine autokinase [Maritimibacter sp.]|nr:polysaccharide biosynthesis tyrosine autokinase [Maritimibacter sp.]
MTNQMSKKLLDQIGGQIGGTLAGSRRGRVHALMPLGAADPEESGLELLDLGRTLWRGKWWIALAVAVATAWGWAWATKLATPLYTAQASVVLEPRQSTVVELEGVMSGLTGDQMTVNTEAEVLTSRRMMGQVVDALDLTRNPAFNPWAGATDDAGTAPSAQVQRDTTMRKVAQVFAVTNVRASYVFNVTAVTEDPVLSTDLANTLARVYVADQLQVKFDATQAATEWLTERVAGLKSELEAAETAVQVFVAGTELISPEALDGLSRQVKDTRARIASLTDARDAAGATLAGLDAALAKGDAAAIARVANDTALDRLIASGAGPDEIRARAETIRRRIEGDRARTEAQIGPIETSLAGLEASFEGQSADLVQLDQMKREAEASRAIYEYFLARLKETAVQQGIQQADARVLSEAAVPLWPSSPNRRRILATTMLFGLLAGAGYVLLREMLNTGFRTAEQLERHSGHSVFGQIPRIKGKKRRQILDYLVEKPTSAAAEAVRNLRTSLLLSNVDRPPKVILSTSAMPGEGKTTVAVALAQNFAGLGQRVLLMEGDIRRRVFDEYFRLEQNAGLLAVLAGEKSFESAVQRIDHLGIDVLVGGRTTTNAADLFSSDRFATLIAGLRKRYDIVIIDMPPVLLVPDTRIVARLTDAVLFSVKWDHTSRAQVTEAIRQFEIAGTDITGLVLTQIDPIGMRKYGYAGKYGAYGGYQSKYYTS